MPYSSFNGGQKTSHTRIQIIQMNKEISFEQCVQIIDETIYDELQLIIDDYITSPRRSKDLREGRITFEEDLKRRETDNGQKTQAVTKFLQYWIADAFAAIVERYNLPIVSGSGAGSDYQYVGNYYRGEFKLSGWNIPIEFKSSGADDGADACLGNLGVNVKCDLTLICRYTLSGNSITQKQTLTIADSGRKWKEYNKAKFDPKTGESKSSNYSSLKGKTGIDDDDIVYYSGNLKKNPTWIHFLKEDITN
jgi:hypothetical protein